MTSKAPHAPLLVLGGPLRGGEGRGEGRKGEGKGRRGARRGEEVDSHTQLEQGRRLAKAGPE